MRNKNATDDKKYVSSVTLYCALSVFGNRYSTSFRCKYLVFSMTPSFHEIKYNAIPIPTMDLGEKRKEHDSPRFCQMQKPEVNYFLPDTAVFQD